MIARIWHGRTPKAKYYPEDREFLLEFEPHVTHWDVTGSAEK